MASKAGDLSVPRTFLSPPSPSEPPTVINDLELTAMSRPNTPPPPADAPKARDIAIDINLPSRSNSLDLYDGHNLVPVDPHEKVHPHHDVVKDRKTGKFYKKVTPAWSLAHAKSSTGRKEPHTQFSVAHSFGARDPATAGSRPASKAPSLGSATPPLGVTSSLSAADVAALVERLRVVVREEVSVANKGHAQHLEKVVNEQLEGAAATNPIEGSDNANAKAGPTSDTKYTTSEQSDISTKDGHKTVIDPMEAERGPDGDSDADEYEFPNPWAKFRYTFREPLAEALGCFILMTFGDGINIQALFSSDYDASSPKGNYLSVSFGWGIAVAMAVYVCGGVSGHINPAVTISLALFRKFPWKKVPGYIFAQIVGATFGALCIYGLYVNPIREVDPLQTEATAQYFTTFPATFIRTASTRISGFYNEVYATAVVLMVILAINDGSNTPPPDGMAPIVLLWLITGVGATLGWQTAYAVNPARDLGPRIALSIVGYRGLWTFDAAYWAYTPLLGPLVGGPLGCFIYDALIYTGSESPLNRPWKWSSIRWRATSKKIPAGITETDGRQA